jgi:hypothetical protein
MLKRDKSKPLWGFKPVKNTNPKRSSNPFWNTKPLPKCKYRSGMPVDLFGDKDRDGVMNVFDCRPRNKRRQDWQSMSKNPVVIMVPTKRLYYQRAKSGTLASNEKSIAHVSLEKQRAIERELEKKGIPSYSVDTEKIAYQREAEMKAKELSEKGYIIKNIKAHGSDYGSNRKYKFAHADIKFTRPSSVYKKEAKRTMQPVHINKDSEMKFEFGTPEEGKKYVREISQAIKSKEEKVPMILIGPEDLNREKNIGEGRHRILAAIEARKKMIPVELDYGNYEEPESISKLRIQEARDIQSMKKVQDQPEILQTLDDEKLESFEKDTDGDGVVDAADCEPTNPDAQGIYHIHKMSAQKRKAILNNRKYLYHKTEHANLPSIIKKGTLQIGDKPFSLSELSNPHIVFKEYKQPVVIVLKKKELSKLRKIDYKNPSAAVGKGTLQVLFESEKEWLAEGKIDKAIKGVIFNEKITKVRNKPAIRGVPTRFVTDKDITRTRFKRFN